MSAISALFLSVFILCKQLLKYLVDGFSAQFSIKVSLQSASFLRFFHVYVRDIIPNGRRLDELSQDDLNEAFSHINSTPRESLKGKTPTEVFDFFYGSELREKLNIRTVDKDEVTLQPYLIRNLH